MYADARAQAPFIVDPEVYLTFKFRVLRENRRVIKEAGREKELEEFHNILGSISMGQPTPAVREFLVQAYVRGTNVGSAENVQLDGSTAISAVPSSTVQPLRSLLLSKVAKAPLPMMMVVGGLLSPAAARMVTDWSASEL